MEFDKVNGNTKWQDAELVELTAIIEYNTFLDKGTAAPAPPGHKKINVFYVYAMKHDGRHKARLVAGGHLTETPIDSVYSSVATLRGVQIIVFLAELNGLSLWSTDIGNAYVESNTLEKIFTLLPGLNSIASISEDTP
jgi:Reverse transcriptase (RNA-dependent DNA polymerase)